jgi:long-subunit acyl-CoA synthetase (AMP-forming)
VVAALGTVGAGAVLVPVNTRFKGGEAAHILRSSGARALFTVHSFLGSEFPAMLAGENLPDLERIILLHDTPVGDPKAEDDSSEVTGVDELPVYGWHEFLAAEDGVVECATAVAGRAVSHPRTCRT